MVVTAEREFVTAEEVAARLGLARTTIYDLIKRGELQGLRSGRSVRVRIQDLERWIAAHSSTGPRLG